MLSKQDFINTVNALYSSLYLVFHKLFLMLATFPIIYRKGTRAKAAKEFLTKIIKCMNNEVTLVVS